MINTFRIEITQATPQEGDGSFYPTSLEKFLRSERVLITKLETQYGQGVLNRNVKAFTNEPCKAEISAMYVSWAAVQSD